MKCEFCQKTAIAENPARCQTCFNKYVEETVKHTIKKYNLIEEGERVCVAASGGKDSITILHLLHSFGYNVEALAVDEGIHVYRDDTIRFLTKFCKERNIPLRVISYKDEIGKRLEDMVPKNKPACNMCGTFRRHILNKYSKEYEKIATGHNLDDESQAVLMNIVNAQTNLFARQGPKTRDVDGFTQKIKPLYFLKEKEIMTYAYTKQFAVGFTECPFSRESFRANLRDVFNLEESKNPGTKHNVVQKYLSMRQSSLGDNPETLKDINKCAVCGFPCNGETCKACQYKKKVANTTIKQTG